MNNFIKRMRNYESKIDRNEIVKGRYKKLEIFKVKLFVLK